MWFGQWAGATTGQWWGDGGGGVVPPMPPDAAHVGGGRTRQRHFVEIDGQYFEVNSQSEAVEILETLREVAKEAAPAAVAKAKSPVTPPRMTIQAPDYSQERTQMLQAQIDATNAVIAETYRQAFAAWQDDEDIGLLLVTGML